ncbi:MAG TPA: hypothetical protein VKA12_04610, partial [Roseiarcus sp.]|nr:hypothetical protein [Roseiarcus sp.]
PAVLAVTDQDKVGNFQAALLGKIQSALTQTRRWPVVLDSEKRLTSPPFPKLAHAIGCVFQ